MLDRVDALHKRCVAHFHIRESIKVIDWTAITRLGRLYIKSREALELQDRPGGTETIFRPIRSTFGGQIKIDRGRVIQGRRHLAGNEAKPNEFVEPRRVFLEERAYVIWMERRIRRPNRFVGVLGCQLVPASPEPG